MLNKAALKVVEDCPTAVGSFKAVLAALVWDQTITKDVAGIVGHALDVHPEIEAALAANVHAAKAKA